MIWNSFRMSPVFPGLFFVGIYCNGRQEACCCLFLIRKLNVSEKYVLSFKSWILWQAYWIAYEEGLHIWIYQQDNKSEDRADTGNSHEKRRLPDGLILSIKTDSKTDDSA